MGKVTSRGQILAPRIHKEHMFATRLEEDMAKEMGVDWQSYQEAVENL